MNKMTNNKCGEKLIQKITWVNFSKYFVTDNSKQILMSCCGHLLFQGGPLLSHLTMELHKIFNLRNKITQMRNETKTLEIYVFLAADELFFIFNSHFAPPMCVWVWPARFRTGVSNTKCSEVHIIKKKHSADRCLL